MKPGICFHFEGIQAERCAAGVVMATLKPGGCPCIKRLAKGETCTLYREPTPEEIAKYQADWVASVERMKLIDEAFAPIVARWKRDKNNRSGTITCPVCQSPANWAIAPNGHKRYACSNDKCFRFIE